MRQLPPVARSNYVISSLLGATVGGKDRNGDTFRQFFPTPQWDWLDAQQQRSQEQGIRRQLSPALFEFWQQQIRA